MSYSHPSLRTAPRTLLRALTFLVLPAVALAQTEHHALSGDRVAIYNLAGKLRAQPVGGSQVTVDVTRGGRDAAQLRVLQGDIRGFSTLRVVYPADDIVYAQPGYRGRTQIRVNADGTFDDNDGWRDRDRVEIRSSGSGLQAFADIVVGVPKGQRIVLHWGVGDAVVSNVDGDVTVDVASSHVTTEHTRGILTLDTGSGGVDVTDAQGDVNLDTGSGGVTVNGVRGESLLMDTGSGSIRGGDIDVKTLKMDVGSGGLRLDRIKAQRVSADAGSGGLELSFIAPVADLTAESGSGGITVRLPASQNADLDIETGSGGIDTDFAIVTSRFARDHVRGTIGKGGARIRLEAGSGGVRLLKS
jgi:hypothetical protein